MMIDPRRSLGDDFKCENTIRAQEIFPGAPDQIDLCGSPASGRCSSGFFGGPLSTPVRVLAARLSECGLIPKTKIVQ